MKVKIDISNATAHVVGLKIRAEAQAALVQDCQGWIFSCLLIVVEEVVSIRLIGKLCAAVLLSPICQAHLVI